MASPRLPIRRTRGSMGDLQPHPVASSHIQMAVSHSFEGYSGTYKGSTPSSVSSNTGTICVKGQGSCSVQGKGRNMRQIACKTAPRSNMCSPVSRHKPMLNRNTKSQKPQRSTGVQQRRNIVSRKRTGDDTPNRTKLARQPLAEEDANSTRHSPRSLVKSLSRQDRRAQSSPLVSNSYTEAFDLPKTPSDTKKVKRSRVRKVKLQRTETQPTTQQSLYTETSTNSGNNSSRFAEPESNVHAGVLVNHINENTSPSNLDRDSLWMNSSGENKRCGECGRANSVQSAENNDRCITVTRRDKDFKDVGKVPSRVESVEDAVGTDHIEPRNTPIEELKRSIDHPLQSQERRVSFNAAIESVEQKLDKLLESAPWKETSRPIDLSSSHVTKPQTSGSTSPGQRKKANRERLQPRTLDSYEEPNNSEESNNQSTAPEDTREADCFHALRHSTSVVVCQGNDIESAAKKLGDELKALKLIEGSLGSDGKHYDQQQQRSVCASRTTAIPAERFSTHKKSSEILKDVVGVSNTGNKQHVRNSGEKAPNNCHKGDIHTKLVENNGILNQNSNEPQYDITHTFSETNSDERLDILSRRLHRLRLDAQRRKQSAEDI